MWTTIKILGRPDENPDTYRMHLQKLKKTLFNLHHRICLRDSKRTQKSLCVVEDRLKSFNCNGIFAVVCLHHAGVS